MNDDLQAKYYEFQMLQEQLQKLQQQQQIVGRQIEELSKVQGALASAKDVKEGTEVLCPIGAGVTLKTKLETAETVVMNVGAGIAVEKRLVDAKVQVDQQIEEMQEIEQQIGEELQTSQKRAVDLQQELQSGLGKGHQCDDPECDHEH